MSDRLKNTIPYILAISLLGLMFVQQTYAYEWAENIAKFYMYSIGLLGIIALFAPMKPEIAEKAPKFTWILHVVAFLYAAAIGWFLAATLYMVATLGMMAKKSIAIDEAKKEGVGDG